MSVIKQRGLGKGIGALFPASPPAEHEPKISIETKKLRPNPSQPRKDFDEEKLIALVNSVRQYGIIQPLIVRPKGDGYEIVAGERRWRAAQRLTLEKVPVVVRDYSDDELMEIALIENIQRHDLNPIEEALAFKSLVETLGLTQEEVAQKIGCSRSAVANVLRLLNLPAKIQEFVSRGTLTMGQARPLLALSNEKQQLALAEKIIVHDMSAREVEAAIKNFSNKKDAEPKKPPDIHLEALQDRLALSLGTQVQIKKAGNKGKIVIDFYSESDLERLLEIFSGVQPSAERKNAGNFVV